MVMPETRSPRWARLVRYVNEIPNARPAPPAADSLWAKDPNRAYTEAVTRALVDAMIDYSTPMNIPADQWLTVAARDDEGRDSLAPQDPLEEVVTMIYRIKGSDLQLYRAGKIDRDEVRKTSAGHASSEGSEISVRRCLTINIWPLVFARSHLSAIALAARRLDQLRRVG